jgi:hypothetical protein
LAEPGLHLPGLRLVGQDRNEQRGIEIEHQYRSSSRIRRMKSGPFLLYRHCIGHRPQCRHIDALARDVGRYNLRDRFAAPRNAHRISGSGLLDQFAQMRFRVGEIDLLTRVS